MKISKYRLYIIGLVPSDLRDRISEIHTLAILKGRAVDGSVKVSVAKIGKTIKNNLGRVW
jgi:hypothetical protein